MSSINLVWLINLILPNKSNRKLYIRRTFKWAHKRRDIMKAYAIVFTIFLLFIVGCAREDRTGADQTPFAGGVEGLSMEFVRGAPPDAIFDNGGFPFSITVLIENLGEHTVKTGEGYLEVTGINPRDFDKGSQADLREDIPTEIDGVVKNFQGTVLLGDKIDMGFDDLNYIPQLPGNFLPTIRANLCYNYETRATAELCVKRDLLTNIDTKEICSVSGEKIVYNSGAPIQITAVEQNPAGSDKIQVLFTISHVGFQDDRFFKIDTECDDVQTNRDKDLVWFEVISDLSGARADCSGLREALADGSGGFIELTNGADQQIVCSFDVTGVDSVYETPVQIRLAYRYYQFIEKPILIKDVSVSDEE